MVVVVNIIYLRFQAAPDIENMFMMLEAVPDVKEMLHPNDKVEQGIKQASE